METVRRLVILVAALALGACSGYDARWKAAKSASKADRYAGAWDGTWTSERHAGQGDSLRCILTPSPGKDGTAYDAEFKAVWMKVISSTHKVTLQIGPPNRKGVRTFSGTSKLSTFVGGGDYRSEGTLTPSAMEARYEANYDSGTFKLSRGPRNLLPSQRRH